MASEETSGETRQFSGGPEHLKDALFAEFSGFYAEKNPQIQKSGPAQVAPASSGLPGSGEDNVLTSGSQPYDPRTNYLTPRPQFLRYNPERLREIYLRRERELGGAEGDSSIEGTPSSSFFPSPSPKQEDGLNLEPFQDQEPHEGMSDGEDDTEEEEEGPSCCNLAWKTLLLLGILIPLIGYISSMYSFSTQSSSLKFQSCSGKYLQNQDALQEAAGNMSVNSEMYPGAYMETCTDAHLDSGNFYGLCKFGEMEGEELQEEDKSTAKDGSNFSVDDVRSHAKPVIVGGSEWSVGSGKEPQDGTQMIVSKGSDFTASGKNQNGFLVMTEGKRDEYAVHSKEPHDREMVVVADDSNFLVNNQTLDADVVLVEGEDEGFITTDKICNPGDENRCSGGPVSEEHAEDVMVATGIEETDDGMALKLHSGKLFQTTKKKMVLLKAVVTSNFCGMKVVISVLMVLGFATSTIFSFRCFKEVKTPVKDSSASSPSSEWASEKSFALPITEKLEKDFHFLANTVAFDVHERYLPAVDSLKENSAASSIRTGKSKEFYETHPPTVELLGEFSVAELGGVPQTGYSSLGKMTARANLRHSQSPETSTSNSLATVDHSPSEVSTTGSTTPQGRSDEEKLGRKQNNRRRDGAEEATSTPLRRSSRIRNRLNLHVYP